MGGENYTDYTLLREVRWDTVSPYCQMIFPYTNYDYRYDTVFDLYEVFFEKPIIVHDTFCVGGTMHNNMMHGCDSEIFPESPTWGRGVSDCYNTFYPMPRKYCPSCIDSQYAANPPFYIFWAFSPYWNNWSSSFTASGLTGTNVNTYTATFTPTENGVYNLDISSNKDLNVYFHSYSYSGIDLSQDDDEIIQLLLASVLNIQLLRLPPL